MRALLWIVAASGLAAALGGCNPAGYPTCFQGQCSRPAFQNSYAGYAPVYSPVGHPAFGELPFDDPFDDYLRRGVTISPGAGNAQAASLALQTATPWPRYSKDTNIPGNGAQMVKAIHEFESGKRPPLAEAAGGGAPGLQINNISGGGAAATGQ